MAESSVRSMRGAAGGKLGRIKERHMGQATQSTSEHSSPQRSGDHVLLTVLGTNPQPTRYVLGDKESEAQLAPVALLNLLPDSEQPRHVLALCTPEAERKSWPLLKDDLDDRYQATLRHISISGSPEEQVNTYLKTVTEAVCCNAEVTVDVSHGFRHFSFLTYIAVLYLAALRNVRVRGAYYGLLGDGGSPGQFLDLRPLLKLPDWIYALKVMDETGSTLPLAKVIKNSGNNEIVTELKNLSQEYLSGLPIELGRRAQTFRETQLEQLRKLLKNDRLPCREDLVNRLDEILKPFEVESIEMSNNKWRKEMVKLSNLELERQAMIIDCLFEHGNMANALRLLSEWTISWVIWNNGHEKQGTSEQVEVVHHQALASPVSTGLPKAHQSPRETCLEVPQWLDYKKKRRPAANLLHMIESIHNNSDLRHTLSRELCDLRKYWKDLSDLRNGYAHHGMRPQYLVGDKTSKRVERIRKYWNDTLRPCPRFSLSAIKDQGRMLVSPMGMATGVLFSALRALQMEEGDGEPLVRCLVICSGQTKGKIAETVECAGYDMKKVVLLCLEDPYGGSGEIEGLKKESCKHFIGATEVVVNVTGGTTLMGLTAQALAGTARRLACPVRCFGLIDRRTHDQQEAEPYRMGEVFWIDPATDPDDADGH